MSLLPSVFVSYARTDSHSIQYAVGLLEAGGAEVFRDIDDIGFGERWEEVITRRINECERVLVFWSKAAQQSEWVGREYKMALKLEKKLVPVMLDSTPLPSDLGAFHALTLSHFTPKTSWAKRYGGWVLGGVATTALAGVLVLPYLGSLSDQKQQELADNQTQEAAPIFGFPGVDENDQNADRQAAAQNSVADAAAQDGDASYRIGAADQAAAGNAGAHAGNDASSAGRIASSAGGQGQFQAQQRTDSRAVRQNQQDNTANFNQSLRPEPKPALAPKPVIVAPNSDVQPTPEVAVEIALEPASPPVQSEGSQLSAVLPWIIGILALLALCWLAVRRYTQRDDQTVVSERFVEMVFDEH